MNRMSKLMCGLFFIGLAIFLIIGLVRYAPLFGFLLVYPYALDQVLGFGLNPHLTKALALAVGFIFWYVIFYFFLSRDGSKRLIGFTLIATIYVSNSLIMYFITRDNVVDIFTGERAFCFEDQMTGRIKIYSQPLFDQLGKKTVRCTDDQIERYEIEKKFRPDQNSEVILDQVEKGFISPKNGRSLFYYCLDTDGKERFFVVSGHCPWGGGKLEPVTNELMKKIDERTEQKRQEERSKLDLENKVAQLADENQQMKLKTQQIADEKQQMKDKNEQLVSENNQLQAQPTVEVGDEFNKLKEQIESTGGHRVVTITVTKHSKETPKAEIYASEIKWCWKKECATGDNVSFGLVERAGVGGVFTHATLRVWKMYGCDSPPSRFKQWSPNVFEWQLAPPIEFQASKKTTDAYATIDLSHYEKWTKPLWACAWTELTITGWDNNKHPITLNLQ